MGRCFEANRPPEWAEGPQNGPVLDIRRRGGELEAPARPGWHYLRGDDEGNACNPLLSGPFRGPRKQTGLSPGADLPPKSPTKFTEEPRCDTLTADRKRALVLELFAQDVQAGLDTAVAEKRQELVRFIEGLWDKYRVTLTDLRGKRAENENRLQSFITALRYT